MRQFDAHGKPLWSPTHDVGIFQINRVHLTEARSMGLDIEHSEEDNITYALYLYNTVGPHAWATYSKCKAEDSS